MFKFLKEKLKKAVSNFTKKVEEEVEEKPKKAKPKKKEAKKKPEKKEKAAVKKSKKKEVVKEAKKEEAEKKEEAPEEKEEEEVKEKKGIFKKVSEVFTTKTLSEGKFDDIFYDLEMALLENNVAVSVIEKIKNDMKEKLVNQKLPRGKIEGEIEKSLKESIENLLKQKKEDFLKNIKEIIKNKKPCVICFFGINGSGKTTTIAKLAHLLKKNNISCVLAAADTFRAAAIDQLQKHGDKLGVKVVKQGYGADAAAVAFDAIEHAKAHRIDVVLIDTAGRSHANVNLMDELAKIIRVTKPDMKVFVGDSLTGNDMVEQAEIYTEKTGIDGIVLAKADVDEKGGAIISVSYVTKKPIYYLGVGQNYDDLDKFNEDKILKNLGFA